MLTSSTRTARAQTTTTAHSASRLPQMFSVAVILLIGVTGLLGLASLVFKMYVPALIFWSVAAGLALTRQVAEQTRVANIRSEEMTRELKLIRLGLSSANLSHTPGQAPTDFPGAPPK